MFFLTHIQLSTQSTNCRKININKVSQLASSVYLGGIIITHFVLPFLSCHIGFLLLPEYFTLSEYLGPDFCHATNTKIFMQIIVSCGVKNCETHCRGEGFLLDLLSSMFYVVTNRQSLITSHLFTCPLSLVSRLQSLVSSLQSLGHLSLLVTSHLQLVTSHFVIFCLLLSYLPERLVKGPSPLKISGFFKLFLGSSERDLKWP